MKKRKTPSYKKGRKVLGSIGMAVLLFSGGAFALPTANAKNLPHAGTFKMMKDNSSNMLRANNLLVERDFDYFDELNKTFSEKEENVIVRPGLLAEEMNFSRNSQEGMYNEDDVFDALRNENYNEWRNAITQLPGYPTEVEPLNEEEFAILAQLRNRN